MLWDGIRPYRAYARALMPFVDLVVGNETEFRAFADGDPRDVARSVDGSEQKGSADFTVESLA